MSSVSKLMKLMKAPAVAEAAPSTMELGDRQGNGTRKAIGKLVSSIPVPTPCRVSVYVWVAG